MEVVVAPAAVHVAADAADLVASIAERSGRLSSLHPYRHTHLRSGAMARWAGPRLRALAGAPAHGETALAALRCCRVVVEAGQQLAGRSDLALGGDLVAAVRAVDGAAHAVAVHAAGRETASSGLRADRVSIHEEARQLVFAVERKARATRRYVAAGRLRNPSNADRRRGWAEPG